MAAQTPVYVVDGCRTPFLRAQGRPGPFTAVDLAVAAGRSLLARQPFAPDALSEVILGCVIPNPDEMNIARITALRLGCGPRMPAWTVHRNCGSGMQALASAADSIRSGRSSMILAGGTEAMSHAPVLWGPEMVAWLADFQQAKRLGQRLAALVRLRPVMLKPVLGLLRGLTDPVVNLSMGQTAEVLADMLHISREDMDSYAERSHHRLALAVDTGKLAEIEPLYDGRGHSFLTDDGLRRDSTLERLGRLRPVFDGRFGRITAGNSAQVTDGAALLLMASEEAVTRHRLPVLGTIEDTAWAGVPPEQMGLGPVHAIADLLQRHRLTIADIEYWEINEAFAAQVLACLRVMTDPDYCRDRLGRELPLGIIPEDRLNVDGGAISLGHPVGASGARIVLHLFHLLRQRRATTGIAALCIGGGQGGAMLLRAAPGPGLHQASEVKR